MEIVPHNRDIINILLTSFSRPVLQVTDPLFPPAVARALRAWAISKSKPGGKISVRNLRYGPRTRLVRGMSAIFTSVRVLYPVHSP